MKEQLGRLVCPKCGNDGQGDQKLLYLEPVIAAHEIRGVEEGKLWVDRPPTGGEYIGNLGGKPVFSCRGCVHNWTPPDFVLDAIEWSAVREPPQLDGEFSVLVSAQGLLFSFYPRLSFMITKVGFFMVQYDPELQRFEGRVPAGFDALHPVLLAELCKAVDNYKREVVRGDCAEESLPAHNEDTCPGWYLTRTGRIEGCCDCEIEDAKAAAAAMQFFREHIPYHAPAGSCDGCLGFAVFEAKGDFVIQRDDDCCAGYYAYDDDAIADAIAACKKHGHHILDGD